MIRGKRKFVCDNCGHKFIGFDAEWNSTCYSQPLKCPKCGSCHTYPSGYFNFITRWQYRDIWKYIDDTYKDKAEEKIDKVSKTSQESNFLEQMSRRIKTETEQERLTAIGTIKEMVRIKGIVDISEEDIRKVLNDAEEAYFFQSTGKGEDAIVNALSDIVNKAEYNGIRIFTYPKILLSISIPQSSLDNLEPKAASQIIMRPVNEFISRFEDGFELKWGLMQNTSSETKVTLIVSKS